MKIGFFSNSPEETFDAGKRLADFLKPGDLLLFSGELGGGKTTFISGLAEGLKISGELSSPSFTILNQYSKGKIRFIHADLYRLDGLAEFDNIGLDEYIYDPRSITCIEWGEKAIGFIKKDYMVLDFQYVLDEDSIEKRKIILKGSSPGWEKRLKKIEAVLNR